MIVSSYAERSSEICSPASPGSGSQVCMVLVLASDYGVKVSSASIISRHHCMKPLAQGEGLVVSYVNP